MIAAACLLQLLLTDSLARLPGMWLEIAAAVHAICVHVAASWSQRGSGTLHRVQERRETHSVQGPLTMTAQ